MVLYRMQYAWIVCAALAIVFLATARSAEADTVVSNLGEAQAGNQFAVFGQWFAAPFVTDSQKYQLTSVTFTLDPGQFPEPSVSFARIYEDDGGGAPGAVLTDLVNPAGIAFGPPGDYVFVAPGFVVLDRNTRYLVSVGSQVPPPGQADQRADWAFTGSSASTGPGSMPGGTFFSSDQGATWTMPNPARNPIFQVEGSVIPAIPALGWVGLLGLGAAIVGLGVVAAGNLKRSHS